MEERRNAATKKAQTEQDVDMKPSGSVTTRSPAETLVDAMGKWANNNGQTLDTKEFSEWLEEKRWTKVQIYRASEQMQDTDDTTVNDTGQAIWNMYLRRNKRQRNQS